MMPSQMPSSQTKYLFVFCEARVFALYCLEVHVTFSLYDGHFRANTWLPTQKPSPLLSCQKKPWMEKQCAHPQWMNSNLSKSNMIIPFYFATQSLSLLFSRLEVAKWGKHLANETVKNSEGFEILPYFQARKLNCHSVIDASRRHMTPESETKDFITYSNISD